MIDRYGLTGECTHEACYPTFGTHQQTFHRQGVDTAKDAVAITETVDHSCYVHDIARRFLHRLNVTANREVFKHIQRYFGFVIYRIVVDHDLKIGSVSNGFEIFDRLTMI